MTAEPFPVQTAICQCSMGNRPAQDISVLKGECRAHVDPCLSNICSRPLVETFLLDAFLTQGQTQSLRLQSKLFLSLVLSLLNWTEVEKPLPKETNPVKSIWPEGLSRLSVDRTRDEIKSLQKKQTFSRVFVLSQVFHSYRKLQEVWIISQHAKSKIKSVRIRQQDGTDAVGLLLWLCLQRWDTSAVTGD